MRQDHRIASAVGDAIQATRHTALAERDPGIVAGAMRVTELAEGTTAEAAQAERAADALRSHAEALRAQITPAAGEVHNTAALGNILYDDYFILFQLAGMILLVAMIGAIVLTIRHRTNVKRQDVLAQMYRESDFAHEMPAAGGDHDYWDTYDQTMRDQARTVVLIAPARIRGNG